MTSMNKLGRIDFKTQYSLPLNDIDDEINVDLFCGGGGASTGLEMGLGRPVHIAINHNPAAISMHEANHPGALHLQTDVWDVDPIQVLRGRLIGWFHFSPDCTHHSQAIGGQPRKQEIRNLSWCGIKWAGIAKPRIISLENVEQIKQWGPLIAKRCPKTRRVLTLDKVKCPRTRKMIHRVAEPGEHVPRHNQYLVPDPKRRGQTWRKFLACLKAQGYEIEHRTLRACDYGTPTKRKRLFMIARRDGLPIVWPKPSHAAKPAKGLKRQRTAADCIDWSIQGQSIFLTKEEGRAVGVKRPLVDATLRRVATGVVREVLQKAQPFIVPIANWSRETVHPVDQPLNTVTAWPRGGSFALTAALLAQANGGFNTTPAHPVSGPMTTVTNTGSQQQLVTASLVHFRGNCDARAVGDPIHVVSAGGNHHGLATAFLSRQFGKSIGQGLDEPAPVVTAGGSGKSALVELKLSKEHEAGALRCAAFLMRYHSTGGQWADLREPMTTVTTADHLALVTVWIQGDPYVIVDIHLRMLQPHELYAAQGFPPNYIIDRGHDGRRFTKSEQVHMCGNAVNPQIMEALARANNPWRAGDALSRVA